MPADVAFIVSGIAAVFIVFALALAWAGHMAGKPLA